MTTGKASGPPLGEFEIVVLLAVLHLSRDTDNAYGSTIIAEIAARTGREVSRGAVYVTLERLEAKRLLTSKSADAAPERGGRPKRYYKATAAGLKAAQHSLATLMRMQAGLEPVLDPSS